MKHTLTAAALSLAIAAAASGAATAQVYQGDMFFTKVAGCTGDGVGDFGQAVFSPAANNKDGKDHLALFGGRGSAMQLEPAGTATALASVKAISFTITGISHTASAGQETVQAGPFTVTPPTTLKPWYTISGVVNKFANIASCDVSMQGTLFPVAGSAGN